MQNHDSVGRIEFHAFTSNLRQRVGLIESQVESVNAQNVGSKPTFVNVPKYVGDIENKTGNYGQIQV